MPLRLPDKLPAIELLKHENIFVMDESRAHKQEIRPLKILVEHHHVLYWCILWRVTFQLHKINL